MMRRKLEPLFATEADLCAAFNAWAQQQGWTPYPETAGFDILLVHGDGTQIGVQAKLRFNIDVIRQILEGTESVWGSHAGPDYRAVLTPESGCQSITDALGVQAFSAERFSYGATKQGFSPAIEVKSSYGGWHYWNPEKRCELPAYVPDVVAGASGPTQLTKWKVGALHVAAVLELRGFVTREDFRDAGIDHRRWAQDWLLPGDGKGRWIAGPKTPDFAAQHTTVYPQIRDKVAKTARSVAETPEAN
jgi:hypothetical protein